MSQAGNYNGGGRNPPYIVEGSAVTEGAETVTAITLPMGDVPSSCSVQVFVSCFEETTPAGGGYTLFGTFLTNGTVATEIGSEDTGFQESAALNDCDVTVHASANNIIVEVTGVADLTINWSARLEYLEVLES